MKKIVLCLVLLLAVTFSLISCGYSIDDVKERLYELEDEYAGRKKTDIEFERDDDMASVFMREIEEETPERIKDDILTVYFVEFLDSSDEYECWIMEFENTSDAKLAEKVFEGWWEIEREWSERKGKIIFLGDRDLIDLILEED